ncbi:MAG: hypothetical protein LBU22_05870 [Dysgonamonadaceae bacterium]|jgi:hypothetical protein|nr:hypothetical protein [Dysgonamonadaceae bacterium]
MNCHRNIDKNTDADFVSASPDFINGVSDDDLISRIEENHIIFTEMDHGYVNPISDKYKQLLFENAKPLRSKNGIFLFSQSDVALKK